MNFVVSSFKPYSDVSPVKARKILSLLAPLSRLCHQSSTRCRLSSPSANTINGQINPWGAFVFADESKHQHKTSVYGIHTQTYHQDAKSLSSRYSRYGGDKQKVKGWAQTVSICVLLEILLDASRISCAQHTERGNGNRQDCRWGENGKAQNCIFSLVDSFHSS